MNDQEFEIINRETKKQKTIDFVKKNKNIFFVFILSIIFFVIGYFSYEMYLNNKRSNLANKFNNSVNSHKIGNNENILNNMVEIINSNEKISKMDIVGRVEFKNLWFSYNPNDYILRDVNFKIDKVK